MKFLFILAFFATSCEEYFSQRQLGTPSDPYEIVITIPTEININSSFTVQWEAVSKVTSYQVLTSTLGSCDAAYNDSGRISATSYSLSMNQAAGYSICVNGYTKDDELIAAGIADITLIDPSNPNSGSGRSSQNTPRINPEDIVLTGSPAAVISGSSLNMSVNGENVVTYKYDILGGGATDCSSAEYGDTQDASIQINEMISADDDYLICIVAIDSNNIESEPKEIPFTRDTTPPGSLDLSGFSVATNDETPSLSWNAATGAASYKVLVDDTNDCSSPIQTYEDITTTTIDLTSISPNGTYYICLSAFDSAGNETVATSSPQSFIVDNQVPNTPNAPTDAGVYDTTSVNFSWTAPSDAGGAGITSYYLQIGTTSGASDVFDANVGNVLTHTITGVDNTNYFARVKAIDAAGNESAYSTVSDGVLVDETNPTAATSLKEAPDATGDADAQVDDDNSIYLVWSAGSDAGSGLHATVPYVVMFYSQTACGGTPAEIDVNGLSLSRTGLSSGTTYSFKIRTVDKAGNTAESSCSNGITIDTTDPDALTSFTGASGTGNGYIDVSLDFPADTSDYDNIKVYRSAGSGSTGVAAPSCGAGTLIQTVTDFSSDPLVISDDTSAAGQYFSYRACIYDAVGNSTTTDTIIDARAKTETETFRLNAGAITGGDNSGDVGGLVQATWSNSIGAGSATLANFDNVAGTSGWDGDGSTGDPYRLNFDGTNDKVTINNVTAKSISIWFKIDSNDWGSRVFDCTYAGIMLSHQMKLSMYPLEFDAPLLTDRWTHVVLTADGTDIKAYIDGVKVYSIASTQTPVSNRTCVLGNDVYGNNYYLDGSISQFSVYSEAINENDVATLYGEQKKRFEADPGVEVSQITPYVASTAGGDQLYIHGWGFDGTSSVLIGGVSAAYTVLSDNVIKVTAPARDAGKAGVTINNGGAVILSDAIRYTDISPSTLVSYLDAESINGVGMASASASTSNEWKSAVLSSAGLRGFNFNTADSGWDGDGSVSDPHRLKFDGTNDQLDIGSLSARTMSVWFKADTHNWSDQVIGCWYNEIRMQYGNQIAVGFGNAASTVTIPTGEWVHVAMTGDGTTVKFFVNGVVVSSVTSNTYHDEQECKLGADQYGTNNFDGSIAEFRAYSNALSEVEMAAVYAESKAKFITDPSTLSIARVYPAAVSTAGGSEISIYGWDFSDVNDVKIGGASVTHTVVSDNIITATVPSAGAGFADVQVFDSGGSVMATNGLYYTAVSGSTLTSYLNAENIDGLGAATDSTSTDTNWVSGSKHTGILKDFNFNTADSGWDGDGTTGDPYRLKFDGTNDLVSIGRLNARTISIWFNIDSDNWNDTILGCENSEIALRTNKSLTFGFVTHDITKIIGSWVHIVITGDGSNIKFFVDGAKVHTASSAAYLNQKNCILGADQFGSNTFDGSIAEFRAYTNALSESDVTDLYNETKVRFP